VLLSTPSMPTVWTLLLPTCGVLRFTYLWGTKAKNAPLAKIMTREKTFVHTSHRKTKGKVQTLILIQTTIQIAHEHKWTVHGLL
jgi:hypothetical protein